MESSNLFARHVEPEPYVVDSRDNAFFPSLKEAKADPLPQIYHEREQTLTELNEHYHSGALKKLLQSNLEKLTLPPDRPRYGPGAIVPNSVLVSDNERERRRRSMIFAFYFLDETFMARSTGVTTIGSERMETSCTLRVATCCLGEGNTYRKLIARELSTG
jgi:hypothetical protein